MDIIFVFILALVAFGIAIYAAVKRHALWAAVAAVVSLLLGVAWAGETFNIVNV